MRFPHTVRLDGPDGSLRITRRLSDLQFRNDVNGGYASGSFTLQRPINAEQIAPFSEVLVFDGRTGDQVGGGRILTPGRTNDQQGQVAKIGFIGEGLASMADVNKPHFLIDNDLGNWNILSRNGRRYDAGVGTLPDGSSDIDMLLFQVNDGSTVNANDNLVMVNTLPKRCSMLLGGMGFRHRSGFSSSAWHVRGRAYSSDFTTFTTPINDDWFTSTSARRKMTVNGDFTNRPVAGLQWLRDAAGTGTEDVWSVARDIIIRAQIYGIDGALRTTGYTNEYVLAGEAFIDWVIRCCPRLSVEAADIAAGTYQFDQLSWPDGIDGQAFIKELLDIEQGLMWGAFERLPDGKYRTKLEILPTDVRYELGVKDGFDDPSPSDELYNVVYVTWTSQGGKPQTTRVPTTGVSPVPELDAAGGDEKSFTLSLGSDVGSTAQAVKAGQSFLADHAVVPNSGQVTINGGRRVYDRFTGRWVAPWEIVPGHLGRIKGVRPRADTLNPGSGPDGSTISRIMSMDWQDSRGSAVLELDTYTLTMKRKIVDLVNNTTRRKRAA